MKAQTIAVLGLGIFGQTVASQLAQSGTEVIAIDRYAENIAKIADQVSVSVVGDFTDISLLKEAGVDRADVAIITASREFENTVLAVNHVKELGVNNIIAKAYGTMVERILYEMGVDTAFTPEKEYGRVIASRIVQTEVDELLQLDDKNSIIEFDVPKSWVGKSPKTLDLRRQRGINLIGYREKQGDKMLAIAAEKALEPDTILVGISHPDKIGQLDLE